VDIGFPQKMRLTRSWSASPIDLIEARSSRS
jgi:hypothetical protein